MVVGENIVIQTHVAVRLRSIANADRVDWIADHLSEKVRFALSRPTAMLLATCFEPKTLAEATYRLSRHLDVQQEAVAKAADQLRQRRLLVDPDDQGHRWSKELLQTWYRYGWRQAADYHLAAYDYPFVASSGKGYEQDRERMRHYRSEEPDLNRSKRYDDILGSQAVPETTKALDHLVCSFQEAFYRQVTEQKLDKPRLLNLVACTFGKIGTRPSLNPRAAATLRKTSPSGGARHPTEVYVGVIDVTDLARGWYHFSVSDNSLELIAKLSVEQRLVELCPALFHRPNFLPKAIVVLTSVFERNMYRYREPRTLRTIFMDAGHLCTTFDIAANALGLQSYWHHGIDDAELEKELRLRPLDEGVLIAAAIGV